MNKRSSSRSANLVGSWDEANRWYGALVGEKGHYYHQSILIPNSLKLLHLQKGASLLDLGCGNGVLARHLPKDIEYTGVDSARKLLLLAKQQSERAQFILADVSQKLPLKKCDFDGAIFLLSLQNIQNGEQAIHQAASHLKYRGRLLLVLNHPCFRIPRQSDWGFDDAAQLQYRRINSYMSSLKIPIAMHPGKQKKSPMTFSFHNPLSTYFQWLSSNQFAVTSVQEWCSDKKSQGSKARIEDRARIEIPLFLAILAEKINPLQ